jgi:hypothetical protein
MDPKWHIAFCNITVTKYAEVSFRDYYSDPEIMLDAQVRAIDVIERRFGVGGFLRPYLDCPTGTLATLLGMPHVYPECDELPSVDPNRPPITEVSQVDRLRLGDPKTDGHMAWRWRVREYLVSRGYNTGVGGNDGSLVTTACEISGNSFLTGTYEDPAAARRLLEKVFAANQLIERVNDDLRGEPSSGAYVGDDYAGLLSPAMFREFVIPLYARIYAGKTARFLHSELLRAEHLRIARDLLDITEFHGAGAELLTPAEMHAVMGPAFWTQVTPHELCFLSPAQLADLIAQYAQSGAGWVQLYPDRATPDGNLEAAIAACERECRGGPTAPVSRARP